MIRTWTAELRSLRVQERRLAREALRQARRLDREVTAAKQAAKRQLAALARARRTAERRFDAASDHLARRIAILEGRLGRP